MTYADMVREDILEKMGEKPKTDKDTKMDIDDEDSSLTNVQKAAKAKADFLKAAETNIDGIPYLLCRSSPSMVLYMPDPQPGLTATC